MSDDIEREYLHRAFDRRVTRRAFLGLVGAAAGERLTRPGRLWASRPAAEGAPVGVVRAGSVSRAVRRAVELAGGVGFIREGQTVLIKPNVNSDDPPPGTTNPEVVYEVVRMVWERGPARVIVADRSRFWGATFEYMKKTGIYEAATQGGAEVMAFDGLPWVRVAPSGAQYWGGGYSIPETVGRVDHLINLPVVKTHYIATFTMALKNFVGLIHPDDRGILHRNDEPIFGGMIAEIGLAITPSLNVTDATRVFVSGGPTQGDVAEPKLVIASRDRIANDVTGLALLKAIGTVERIQGRSVWAQPQIARAVELGLGAADGSQIALRAEGVLEIEAIQGHIGGGATAAPKVGWGKIKSSIVNRRSNE